MKTTWREQIALTAGKDEIDLCTLSEEELDVEFDNGYGRENGKPFYAWSEEYVYFHAHYDGSEWCGSVPRNPSDEPPTMHGG